MAAILANGLRRLMGESQRLCGLRRISPTVPVVEIVSGDGKSHRLIVEGVHRCKSTLCPLCVRKWQRTRCGEIQQALDYWNLRGAERVIFFTGTFKHHPGMNLALQHRLLTKAYGELWSGRRGQDLADVLGGKPESIRAHDRTFSVEHRWHPHLHSLMFLERRGYTVEEIQGLLDVRWRESLGSGLRSFKRIVRELLGNVPCRVHKRFTRRRRQNKFIDDSCSACIFGVGECPYRRERATRAFGAKLIRRGVPMRECLGRVSEMLDAFDEESIRPSEAHGIKVELVTRNAAVSTYLTKLGAMGFELACSTSKFGHEDENGIVHYGPWELARMATIHGHPLRTLARRAWSELFRSTFATQTITFSSRKRLGLGVDPYANGEPAEADVDRGETRCVKGEIEGPTWDGMALVHQHGVLVTLQAAHRAGLLEELPFIKPPAMWAHTIPSTKDPPERGPPVTPDEREQRWRAQWDASCDKGMKAWQLAVDKLGEPSTPIEWEFLEEVRERLELANASRGKGKPLRQLLEELAAE